MGIIRKDGYGRILEIEEWGNWDSNICMCKACGSHIKEGLKECPACGSDLRTGLPTCHYCGKKRNLDGNCKHCGAPSSNLDQPDNPDASYWHSYYQESLKDIAQTDLELVQRDIGNAFLPVLGKAISWFNRIFK